MTDQTEEKIYNWDEYYQQNTLPWDSGKPAPELEEYFAALKAKQSSEPLPRHVLEVGCGTGTNAIWLAEHGCKVTATEIAPTALAAAQKKSEQAGAPEIAYKLIDICQTAPVADSTQDFVFDRGVYHVIPASQRPLFVSRIADALKPGGRWLTVAGNRDEDRENPEAGPPQLSAIQLLTPVEPHFIIEKLERSYFILEDGSKHLAWKATFIKRALL
jgi:SAM-dependent methyltransferase